LHFFCRDTFYYSRTLYKTGNCLQIILSTTLSKHFHNKILGNSRPFKLAK